MKSNDIFIGLALDRSGSMTGIWEPTLSSINEFVGSQANQPGEGWITLVTFDDYVKTPYYAWGLKDFPKLNNDLISPGNMTALRDGIGETIHLQEQWLSENLWFTGKVMTVVQTDGLENASTKYSNEQIKALIKRKEEAGWLFVYLGANQNAWSVGSSMGMSRVGSARTYEASAKGVSTTYTSLSNATSGWRSGTSSAADFDITFKPDTK